MGDIIISLKVRSSRRRNPRPMNGYFDSGSPFTFVSDDAAKKLGSVADLDEPSRFEGLGDGSFEAHALIEIQVRLKGYWCKHVAYVAPRRVIQDDILVGHDFMQRFGIRLDPKHHTIDVSLESVRHAQVVRGRVRER